MLDQMSLTPMDESDLASHVRSIPDYPKPGIEFKDITPLLSNPSAFQELTYRLAHAVKESGAECVVGLEARGFIVGTAVALELGVPFVPARKPGKLPNETVSIAYELEYGSDSLEMHADSFAKGTRVAIVDDLLATGGTANACSELIKELGGEVAGCFFAIELEGLPGRERLSAENVYSIMVM